ncbi:MAG TPA: flagellar basal body-associated FliL family protein [Burkholderiaceae bacterium]|nr:flagellar basal body-associated FliL family protein [Burkholderiaceae bacterium]
MSSAAAPATTANAAEAPVPAKGKKKLIIIIAIALLVVLAGGGAALYILKKRAAAAAEEAGEDGAVTAQAQADKPAHRGPPTFVPLEPFVVNLADKDNDRYAQIAVTLEVDDAKFADEMKLYMPAIRNAILMILAHKHSSELLDRAGKQALADEIMREAVRPMGIEIDAAPAAPAAGASAGKPARPPKEAVHNPVRRVHFASFIVQ